MPPCHPPPKHHPPLGLLLLLLPDGPASSSGPSFDGPSSVTANGCASANGSFASGCCLHRCRRRCHCYHRLPTMLHSYRRPILPSCHWHSDRCCADHCTPSARTDGTNRFRAAATCCGTRTNGFRRTLNHYRCHRGCHLQHHRHEDAAAVRASGIDAYLAAARTIATGTGSGCAIDSASGGFGGCCCCCCCSLYPAGWTRNERNRFSKHHTYIQSF